MGKKVIVIGGTIAREHALAWKLSQSDKVEQVYITPGNGGASQVGENVGIDPADTDKLVNFCKDKSIDLAVISTDDLLAAGLADTLRDSGIAVFGSSKKASRIESSKAFSKDLMKRKNIPTASYETFIDVDKAIDYAREQKYPLVVKASGLALGKGVIICADFKEAKQAIEQMLLKKAFKSAGETIVIEEFLQGSEVSFHALSDGHTHKIFPTTQDHKQVYDGDKGPNTGGMGAFGPISWVSEKLMKQIDKEVIKPALEGLDEAGSTFNGCLYPGLMMTAEGPKVLEYNARFGDPETQVYMRLLDSDLYDLLHACAAGKLQDCQIAWKPGFAVSVVLASGGYPGKYEKGLEISGIEEAEAMEDIIVFHAGTKNDGGKLVTSGGRVLNVTSYSDTLENAIEKAYKAVDKISFEGMQYRKDIGRRTPPKELG